MTKTTLLLAALLSATTLSAQDTKGAHPINQSTNPPVNQTRAVVVGISDYQDAAIPDLRFAHRDAEAFANFLRSPAGGALDGDHLKVLLNEQATAGQVISALTWLLEESRPSDQAIIYFSGHGDVEAKLLNQLGFLLLWDSPAHVYLTGALPVDMLRQLVSTLSIEQKTKVFVVVDACRAGKLAGNTVIGTQLTGSQLAQQFSQEQKVLSCQPNEFSIEGEQWGGGRGVFSYHLCNGLYGLADGDRDGQVSLFEIGRYLEDRVPKEVSPLSQLPLTVGDKSGPLFSVDGPTLAVLEKLGVPPVSIARVEQRGMLQEVLAKADSSVRFWYAGFERTLRRNHFFEPEGACAEFFFQKLMATESIAALHPMLKRNYAAALQDDAQQAINIWLAADVQELECIGKSLTLDPIPRQLARAAELLGEGHYMYRPLLARRLLFEGIMQQRHFGPDETLGKECLSLFRQSLEFEPQSPLPWHRMSLAYAMNLRQPDSAFFCAHQAWSLAPNWVLPYVDLAYAFSQLRKSELAKQALEKAEAIDSRHPYVFNRWAIWLNGIGGKPNQEKAAMLLEKYRESRGPIYPCWLSDYGSVLTDLGRYSESEALYMEAISLDSTNASAWNNLGNMYRKTRRYAEAEQILKKAISLDSTDATLRWANLGNVYRETRRYAEAEAAFKNAISLDSTNAIAWNNLGLTYDETRRYAEAEKAYKKVIVLDSTTAIAWANLGTLYYRTRRYAEAEQVLKKAIALDSTNIGGWNYLGLTYNNTRRFAEAEPVLKKVLELDSTNVYAWNNLGYLYYETRRLAEAEQTLKNAIALASTVANPHKHLGMVYFKSNRPKEARQSFLVAIELDPNYAAAMLGMAYLLAFEGKTTDALGYVEQAIGKGVTYEQLEKDEDLAPLRALPEWKALMKKYFPDKVKD